MNPKVKNIIAIIAGLILGSIVNMAIITVSHEIIPLPEGIDPTNMESLKQNIHRFEPINFLMPFLAHALGTLVGAYIAYLIAGSQKAKLALVVGGIFLVLGAINAFMLPAPLWFNIIDLLFAYIPMAWIATKLGKTNRSIS